MSNTGENAFLGKECKHVCYASANDGSRSDLLLVKEYIHEAGKEPVPQVTLVADYKRNFWVTKEGYQKHPDKKEWEEEKRLNKFTTTQVNLTREISKALNKQKLDGNSLRMLARNQYLYGCDVTTPVLMKQQYMSKWPNCISPNSVAVLDIETDVVRGTEEIICISITFRDRAILVYTKEFVAGITNVVEGTHSLFEHYLGEHKAARNIKLEVMVVDTPALAVIECINRAHQWMPDFIAIWNINFDLPKIIQCLERERYDLGEVFSHPSVPNKFRQARFIEGAAQKVTASGKSMPLHPADRWHTMECMASFYFIDAMCVYKKIRVAKGNEPSYSLDAILHKHLGIRKLKFVEADAYSGLKWHQFMQANYKIEYGVYNLFDCISVELLDEKTKDLSSTMSVLCGFSEYHRFPSQPRRTVDDLHFLCQEDGLIIATTSDKMEDELDKYVVEMTNWIVTLPAHQVVDNGLALIKEFPNIHTSIRAHVADLDVSGAYPNTEDFMNISKETTYRELCRIKGVNDLAIRRAGINMTAAITNAVEISCDLFGLPTFDTLLEAFETEQGADNN